MALIIGEKNPKLVESEDIGNLARASYGKPEVGTAIKEQNEVSDVEDEAAKQAAAALKAQQEKEAEEKSAEERSAKLEEIGKLPEEEQVAALLEAGFEEEAAALSAKIAEKQGAKEDNTDNLPSPDEVENGGEKPLDSADDIPVQQEGENKVEKEQDNAGDTEQEKPKRGGRPKKS